MEQNGTYRWSPNSGSRGPRNIIKKLPDQYTVPA